MEYLGGRNYLSRHARWVPVSFLLRYFIKNYDSWLQMDTALSGDVSWDELISFLLIELLESQDIGEPQEDMLRPPIASAPEVFAAHHRHPVIRLTFVPRVNKVSGLCNCFQTFLKIFVNGAIYFRSVLFARFCCYKGDLNARKPT